MTTIFADIQRATGANRADIFRVATRGGVTEADWAIAHAIEQVTGRSAAETMWAGRARQADLGQVIPTNPRAEYDETITVYPENTSPEATPTVLPDHPSTHEDDTLEDVEDTDTEGAEEQAERVAANHLANQVFSDLAEVLDNPGAAHRLTRAWTTPAEGRQVLVQVLEVHAGTHLRTEIAVHQIEAELAA